MFNDRFGLTEAVLAGRKTMTRRTFKLPDELTTRLIYNPVMGIDDRGKVYFTFDCIDSKQRDIYPHYQIGEVIAIAQRYQDIPLDTLMQRRMDGKTDRWPFESLLRQSHGWTNKQGVLAKFMPHRIKITNIKIERLQDISEEDAMREGIYKNPNPPRWREYDPYEAWHPSAKPFKYTVVKDYCKARFAFADLINRVSGSGTWEMNPWVFAYEFQLIK